MRIGLVIGLHELGAAFGGKAPAWGDVRDQVAMAEYAGFELVVLEDALVYGGRGHWEAMTVAGGLAASSTTIGISHSVVNAPMRLPAVVAKAAITLDEISGGRYTLGLGAGNTPDEYEAFAMAADPRYSRFAEYLAVVHALLRGGEVDLDGTYYSARTDRFTPTGPRPNAIPIVVAAGGPKMIELTVRYADGWNWWGASNDSSHLPPILESLARSCEESGRDPATIDRSVDVYSFDPLGVVEDPPENVHTGTAEEMAAAILGFADLGFDEARIDVIAPSDRRVESVEAMSEVVDLVRSA